MPNPDDKFTPVAEITPLNRDFLRKMAIPKLPIVKRKQQGPPTVKTELFTKAEFIASQISPPKVYCPPHVISS